MVFLSVKTTTKKMDSADLPPSRNRQVCVILGDAKENPAYAKGVALRACHVFKKSGRAKSQNGYLRTARRQLAVNGRASRVLFLIREFPLLENARGRVLEIDSIEVKCAIRGIATESVPTALAPSK